MQLGESGFIRRQGGVSERFVKMNAVVLSSDIWCEFYADFVSSGNGSRKSINYYSHLLDLSIWFVAVVVDDVGFCTTIREYKASSDAAVW